jgi:hypothetical protein
MNKILRLFLIFLLLAGPALVKSQTVGGTLTGRVTNVAGTGIPNAAITVTNTAANTTRRALSGPDGAFSIANLSAGVYKVEVETAGHKRSSQQNVELSATGTAAITIQLEAGNANETVELRGRAPAIQSEGGQAEMGIDGRNLRELPIIDRNHQELIGLDTGITPPQPALDVPRDPERNRFAAVNGQPPTSNLWVTDGVMNQEPFRHTAVRVQPVESLQTLQMETASLRAERGFAGGGVFSSITRPGTNDWHGSLFEFHSNNQLRTRNYFNPEPNPDARLVYNQFGATFGGPIVKDRTFLFGSYEGTYQNGAITQLTTVPTPGMIAGNFSGIPGLILYQPTTGNAAGQNRTPFLNNVIPAARINRTAAALAGILPAPNLPGFANNLVANVPLSNHGNKVDIRVDDQLGDRTHALLRYGFTNYRAVESSPLFDVLGAGTRSRNLNHTAVAGLQHNFTRGLAMDLRMGYNRYEQRLNPLSDQTQLATFFGRSFANNLVGINISGMEPVGTPAYTPMRGVDNTLNWVWNWGWHTSSHNLKWGVDVRRIRSDGFRDAMWSNVFGSNGTAFFGPGVTLSANGQPLSQYGLLSNSFAAFLLGLPTQVGVSNFITEPTIRQTQWGAWLGDVFQLGRRISIDAGVRYEVYSPLEPRNSGGAAFYDANLNVFNYAGIGDVPMRAYGSDTNNIAPRVGVSVRPADKTVVRAGYSIQYFQSPYMLSGLMAPMSGSISGTQGGYLVAPFSGTFGPTLSSTVPRPDSLTNGASALNLPATVLPSNPQTPYVHSFNAQVQQEFYWGTVLSAGYAGSLGRQLPYVQELNASLPGTGTGGLPLIGFLRTASTLGFGSGVNSNYHSLQTNLTKRFSHGLSFIGSYTWSRAQGYTTANGMLLNPFDLEANYGVLDYDQRHMLSFSHLWDLPFGRKGGSMAATLLGGWQWNGVFRWNTGAPLTATADPISCACPNNTVLANLTGDPYANTSGNLFLNPAAFSAPSASLGNSGRGTFRADDTWNYNTSLFKNFRVRDRFNMQLRGEGYNVTNRTQFAPPVTNIASPNFGRSVATVNGAFGRQVNLGLRVSF